MTTLVVLNNTGSVDNIVPGLYFPRLQINKRTGEIVLATSKHRTLTTGILVAKTPDSQSKFPLGKKFDDWEVVGPLEDYNGEITITIRNKVKKTK